MNQNKRYKVDQNTNKNKNIHILPMINPIGPKTKRLSEGLGI